LSRKRRNGEGTIHRRKGGGWCAQYTVYTAEGRKRKTLYGKTRAEVAAKLTKALSDREDGVSFDAENYTLGEYLDRWLMECVKGTVKETINANYSYITHVHISPALGRVKLKSLTPAHVRNFYGEKIRTNLSATTVKKLHVVLRRALSHAVSDELIARNVADSVKPPRASAPGDEIRPLTSDECSSFLEASGGERLETLYVLAVH
jgi:integrase